MSTSLEPRVSELETALKELAYAQLRTERSLEELSKKHDLFHDEMLEFKNESQRQTREMNRKWGDLANKMGTLVEDIVAPGFPGVLKRYFGVEEPDFLAVRPRKKHPSEPNRRREFDMIAVTPDRLFVDETKSSPKRSDIEQFAQSFREVVEFFPEYADREVIPIFSALYLPQELVDLATEHAVYAMSLDDSVDLLNYDAVSAR